MLDLNLGQLQAAIAGYGDRLVDLECLTIYSGYYSSYYSNTKHPKQPHLLIKKIISGRDKQNKHSEKPVVDMDAEIARFERLEKKRLHGR